MVYLSLGSNMGDKCQNLKIARHRLEETGKIRVVKASSFYLTEPWGKTDQDWFVNQVLAVETGLEPLPLLDTVLAIEERMGRVRQERWGPRTIDIDILLIDDQVINSDRLTVPHPRLYERGFVIIPLLEIAPGLVLPGRLPLQQVWENLVKNQETGCIKKLTCDKMSQRNIENG
ncbi:MAG TPA: 2-amino-4-hydroxy-6-hydroxymethyldihydropteridine diphosphokinase [Syntrophothermus lipocalidus]|nr:2-amino-4-hydroxy-6-hydroxymethyldihydropteridine diphosphokinase [Syntrophothermus lipocalidus]HOV42436.1 2-amino-4-hydroxy-6-hydroxymethyldihydropteridine diphosphokinase [Syntrophothermus lipocalidus]